MQWIHELARRLRILLHHERLDRDLEEEMRAHLEMSADENRANGMPAEEARYAAQRQFGNAALLKETSREMWGWRHLDALIRDTRYALRTLRRSPGFTAVVVLVLALGIGGSTTVFSLVNALVLSPFPYPEPDRLVAIQVRPPGGEFQTTVPIHDFFDWREQNSVFEEMAAYGYARSNVTGFREPERLIAGTATSGFLRVLGVRPVLGRFFTPAEAAPGGPALVVLSYGTWKRQFGGRNDVLGKTLAVNGQAHTIIGVMPVRLPLPGMFACDLWRLADYSPAVSRGTWMSGDHPIARLKPGVPMARAQANLKAIAQSLAQQYPATNRGREVRLEPIGEEVAQGARPFLTAPAAAVGLVLMAACANLAGLWLARGLSRAKETAMRISLGADRLCLMRQTLAETVLLSLCGGALGLLFARWGIQAVIAAAPPMIGLSSAVRIDSSVLWFAFGVSVLTGVSFGLIPATCASRPNLSGLLAGGVTVWNTKRRSRLIAGLVVAEVALAMVLLAGGGLLAKNYYRLLRVDAGFNPENLLTFQLGLQDSKYGSDSRRREFYGTLLERLRGVPGVRDASAVSPLPMSREYSGGEFRIDGRPDAGRAQDRRAQYCQAAPGYFRTMGIRVVLGREFQDSDSSGPPFAVVINQALARRFFPGENPLGQRINGAPIVGVVGDVRHNGPSTAPEPQAYAPLALRAPRAVHIAIRTAGDPMKLVPLVRGVVRALDPGLPLDRLKSMRDVVADSVSDAQTISSILGGFALFAVALAALGIYGVIAYSVNQRAHEIGVRAALGATSGSVLAMVVRQGALLGVAGVAIGLPAALAASRVVESLLFETAPHDTSIFAGVSVLLLAVTLVASYLPARRAARIDPMEALRHE